MKNDQERENRLKEAVRDALSTVCWKDENGVFYEEIYADYRDTLDDCTLKKICNDDHPREKLWELLDEWYRDCEWEYADNVIKRVLEDEDVAELIENPDADEIRELIRDQFYIRYPEKHFLKEDVLIDLVIDTGDLNYDFTSNIIGGHYNASDDSIPEEASLLWLARQQGYKKSELKKALADRGNSQSPLLKSIYRETLNCGSHMNALAFLVKMTLEEYFTLRDASTRKESGIKATAFPNVPAAAICFSPRTQPVGFMIPGTAPAVSWKSNWKKMSAYRSAASLRQTMMAVIATVSGKFTAAVLIYGVIMPSN